VTGIIELRIGDCGLRIEAERKRAMGRGDCKREKELGDGTIEPLMGFAKGRNLRRRGG